MSKSSVHTPVFSRAINLPLILPTLIVWQYASVQVLFLSILFISELAWPVISTLCVTSMSASVYFYLKTYENYQGELAFSPQTGWRLRRGENIETLVLKKVSFVGNNFLMLTFKRSSKPLFTPALSYVLTYRNLGESNFKQLRALIVTGNCY